MSSQAVTHQQQMVMLTTPHVPQRSFCKRKMLLEELKFVLEVFNSKRMFILISYLNLLFFKGSLNQCSVHRESAFRQEAVQSDSI